MDLLIVNLLIVNRSCARLPGGGWCFHKILTESAHWTTTLGRPIEEGEGRQTAGSGAGNQASTGTPSRPRASVGVRIVGSKYSVVKPTPTLNAMASPKASRK